MVLAALPWWKKAFGWRSPRRWSRTGPPRRPSLEALEHRLLLSGDTLKTTIPLSFPAYQTDQAAVTSLPQADASLSPQAAGTLLGSGQVDVYPFTITSTLGGGQLTARVATTAGTLVPRLRLNGADGQVVIQSDRGILHQHLQPGTYSLAVSAGTGAGSYQLSSQFVPGRPALAPVRVGQTPKAVAAADLNRDGIPDTIVANSGDNTVSVLLGLGDGTFRNPRTIGVGPEPQSVAVADFNGDGRPDLVTANRGDNTVSVLLGNGDGTFQNGATWDVGSVPQAVAVADFNGDGRPDLVTANRGDDTVSVLLSNSNGTFQKAQSFAVGSVPYAVAVADFNGDGRPDLVTANSGDRPVSGPLGNTVSTLLGNGDGTFQKARSLVVGSEPESVAVADLDGDGPIDIVAANFFDNTVSVLRGKGDGTFQKARSYVVGSQPQAVAVADVNGDAKLDLVTANLGDNRVSVLSGNGDGTFQNHRTYTVGTAPQAVAVADLDGDGRADLVTANKFGNTMSTLLGNGDSTFRDIRTFAVGSRPYSVAVADVNGDGKPDLATANYYDNTVSVLLGTGDGTFQNARTFAVGAYPQSVAVADVNGDGRSDLVTANRYDNTVSVLLGNGDGTFQNDRTFPVATYPQAVTVADVNGDGRPDLITANNYDDTVSVLLGNGDGSFQKAQTFAVGSGPQAVAVGDINGDDKLDIATANTSGDTVSLLLGLGNGKFQSAQTFAVGLGPDSVSVTDVNSDGKPDLLAANNGADTVSVLLSRGDSTFEDALTFAVGSAPHSMTVTDVNGDRKPDLITANNLDDTVSVLLGNGNGRFLDALTFSAGSGPESVAVADINQDGQPDIVIANRGSADVSVLLGNGTGTFILSTPLNGVGSRNTPFLADLNDDGIPDSVILDSAGNIIFRKGLAGTGHSFASPLILNNRAAIGQNRSARDLTVLPTGTGWALATADTKQDPLLSSAGHFVYTVSLYRVAGSGTVTLTTAFATSLFPTRIASADLTGDGLDDLVVASALNNSIQVSLQQPDGTFSSPRTLPVGLAPSTFALVDGDGDGHKDIVVSNQASGTVTVLLGDGTHPFTQVEVFRTGTGLSEIHSGTAGATVHSLDQPVSLVAGRFTSSGRQDLVVVNRGTHSFTVLVNTGSGFSDPLPALTTSTSAGPSINDQPGPVLAGEFDRDGRLDLAILMMDRGEIWIYTGKGDGTFTLGQRIPVGSLATGLSVVPGSRPGVLDLLAGNSFGDVLILRGNGDGTFQPYTRVDQAAPFATIDLHHNGRQDVVLANQATDRVMIQVRKAGTPGFTSGAFSQQGHDLRGPGAVKLADLNADDRPDLIVANSEGNDLLVYLGLPGGRFASQPRLYFVGTNPAGITVQDLNHDGLLDLAVANKGSNDVSVLFGKGIRQAAGSIGSWGLKPGPRLKAGFSPLGVTFRDMTGDRVPDMIVTDGQTGPGGNITLLPGIGRNGFGTGFFQDNNPLAPLNVPGNPIGALASGLVPAQPGLFFLPTTQGIFQVNLDSRTIFQVFASTTLTAFSVGPGGEMAAGFRNGSVALLAPDDTGLLVEARIFRDSGLTSPSALQLVSNEGQPEIYATSVGEDRVFVFALSEGIPVPGFTTSFETRGLSAEVQPLGSVGVSLAATFVTDPGTESLPANMLADSLLAEAGFVGGGFGVGVGDLGYSAFAANLVVLAVGAGKDPDAGAAAGEGPDEEPQDAPAPPGDAPESGVGLNGYLSGLTEALGALRRLIRNQRGNGPEADRPRPADLNLGEPLGSRDPWFRLVPGSAQELETPAQEQVPDRVAAQGAMEQVDGWIKRAAVLIPAADGVDKLRRSSGLALRDSVTSSSDEKETFAGPVWYPWQRGLLLGILLGGLWHSSSGLSVNIKRPVRECEQT